MSGIHDHELAYFVDSLTPHQRVYLQRLLGEFLTSFPPDDGEPHPEWYRLHRMGAQTLFDLVAHLRQFENQDDESDIRPYALTVPEPGHAVVRLARSFTSWHGLWDPASHAWVREITCGRLTVDLQNLTELTSSGIAWLVTLSTHIPSRKVYLINAAPAIVRALRVLHLDAILVPVTA